MLEDEFDLVVSTLDAVEKCLDHHIQVPMNEADLIQPSTVRDWEKNSAFVESLDNDSEKRLEQALDVGALLAGIRFLHDFVKTQEGELAVERAFDEGFVQLVSDDRGKRWAIPRFIWRDRIYHDLCPDKGDDVSIGIQIARYMLWAPPGFVANHWQEGHKWGSAIHEARHRFEAELDQRRQQLAAAIREAAVELAARGQAGTGNDNRMAAISSVAIFELIRLTIPDVTQAEVDNAIMQTLPYTGGPRH
jgi:hypothetical protein